MRRMLSLVERGWSGARTCSLDLAGVKDIQVIHLVRGRLDPQTRAMITPYAHIRIEDAPKRWYAVWLFAVLLREIVTGQLRWVVIDHERHWVWLRSWLQRVGVVPILISGEGTAYELRVNGVRRSLDEFVQRVPS